MSFDNEPYFGNNPNEEQLERRRDELRAELRDIEHALYRIRRDRYGRHEWSLRGGTSEGVWA